MKAHTSSGYYKWRALIRLRDFYFRADWCELNEWLNFFCESLTGCYLDYYWKVNYKLLFYFTYAHSDTKKK